MNVSEKEIVIIEGGNGAGKTTFAHSFLQEYAYEFLNADEIAKSLSANNPDGKKISAGKLFFQKLNKAVAQNKSLLIERAQKQDYQIRIVFPFVASTEILIERIAERVKKGGHFVPDEDVQRRFVRGRKNFLSIYKDLADTWFLYYNIQNNFQLIATGEKDKITVSDEILFKKF